MVAMVSCLSSLTRQVESQAQERTFAEGYQQGSGPREAGPQEQGLLAMRSRLGSSLRTVASVSLGMYFKTLECGF